MIYRAAGVCSIDPAPFSLGELVLMLEQRERSEWTRTSALMALVANGLNTKKGQTFSPDDFNPYRDQRRRQTVSATELGEILGFKKQGKGTT